MGPCLGRRCPATFETFKISADFCDSDYPLLLDLCRRHLKKKENKRPGKQESKHVTSNAQNPSHGSASGMNNPISQNPQTCLFQTRGKVTSLIALLRS